MKRAIADIMWYQIVLTIIVVMGIMSVVGILGVILPKNLIPSAEPVFRAIPTVTPTQTPTPSPTATYTPSPTATYTPSPTATYTPTPTPSPSPTPSPTPTPLITCIVVQPCSRFVIWLYPKYGDVLALADPPIGAKILAPFEEGVVELNYFLPYPERRNIKVPAIVIATEPKFKKGSELFFVAGYGLRSVVKDGVRVRKGETLAVVEWSTKGVFGHSIVIALARWSELADLYINVSHEELLRFLTQE